VSLFVHARAENQRLTHDSQPRTYLVSEQQRAKVSSSEILSWILLVFQTSDWVILQKSGLDAFFFLRYLRTLLRIFIPLSLTIISILIPLNLVDEKNAVEKVQGLNRLSWGNVRLRHIDFYWAHLIMALSVIIFVCHTMYMKLLEYIRVRQAYLTSPQHRLQAFANTILVTNISKRFLFISALTHLYSNFSGGIRTIWINRDLAKLSRKAQERRKVVFTLKVAETKLMRLAMKSSEARSDHELTKVEKDDTSHLDVESKESLWKRYLGKKNREYMRLSIFSQTWMPSIPFVESKVDIINHCWQEMARLNNEIDQNQRESEKYSLTSSAFIQFNTQEAAYMTCQSLVHCTSLCLRSQYIEASSVNVRWKSLFKKWWDRYTRSALALIAVVSLIIAWAISVVFTDLVFQITYLTSLLSWLHWIDRLSTWLLDFIEDVLSQLILILLTMLLPLILRAITRRQSLLTKMIVELSLQKYYFAFLFMQVFLTVFLSSSITTVAQEILHDLNFLPTILATNLSKASNYFFSYLLLRGFSISAGSLLQMRELINWIVLVPITSHTPRQKWERQTVLPQMQWGTLFPIYTNLACIDKLYLYHLFTLLKFRQKLYTQWSLHWFLCLVLLPLVCFELCSAIICSMSQSFDQIPAIYSTQRLWTSSLSRFTLWSFVW